MLPSFPCCFYVDSELALLQRHNVMMNDESVILYPYLKKSCDENIQSTFQKPSVVTFEPCFHPELEAPFHPFKLRLPFSTLSDCTSVRCIHPLVCSLKALHDSSAEAVKRIYEIKGCIHTRPLAICVADVPDISRFAVVDHLPHGLLGENSILERSLNLGLDSIGVRVPNLNFVRAIARGAGNALALTSAYLSGRPSCVSVKDFEDLWPHCSNVFDGGILPSGRAGSTIVDLITPGVYKIIRDGSSREETTAVLDKFGFVEAS